MPTADLLDIAATLRTAADALAAAAEREARFEALANAVLAFDGDGLGQTHLPQWTALVAIARQALGN